MALRSRLLALACALGGLSCASEIEPRTQLMLVADTDIEALDTIEFTIEGPNGQTRKAQSAVTADGQPRYLGLFHEGGPLGPFDVSATGFAGDTVVIDRHARVSFVRGKTLVVPLHLVESCREAPPCKQADYVCTENGCRDSRLDSASLKGWSGSPPSLNDAAGDAGGSNGGSDGGSNGTPDGGSNGTPDGGSNGTPDGGSNGTPDGGSNGTPDGGSNGSPDGGPMLCDGSVVDYQTDPNNCRTCGNVCMLGASVEQATPACRNGACTFACIEGFGHCDSNLSNGCETNLMTTTSRCGSCTNNCGVPGQWNCVAGKCVSRK
jgi:hypothetical protein